MTSAHFFTRVIPLLKKKINNKNIKSNYKMQKNWVVDGSMCNKKVRKI